jgi:hypothetical protein
MYFKNNLLLPLLVSVAIVITIHACAGMGGMRGDEVKIYHESIDKMVEISREAIHNKGYSVTNIQQRRESGQRTTITFVNRSTAGQQMVSSMQAYVHLAKVDTADAVEVRINNPDYDYGTPTDQRLDYAKVLFDEIDELLK